jgi:hypothetical protein
MSAAPNLPEYEYLAYIDEAGETGLKRILSVDQRGSSEWFILSLVLVPKSEECNLASWVADIMRETARVWEI